jgi:hypothetical protein
MVVAEPAIVVTICEAAISLVQGVLWADCVFGCVRVVMKIGDVL